MVSQTVTHICDMNLISFTPVTCAPAHSNNQREIFLEAMTQIFSKAVPSQQAMLVKDLFDHHIVLCNRWYRLTIISI
jgi:hypothetical protein